MIFIEHLQVKLSRAIMNCEKNTSNYKNRRENFQGKKTLRKKNILCNIRKKGRIFQDKEHLEKCCTISEQEQVAFFKSTSQYLQEQVRFSRRVFFKFSQEHIRFSRRIYTLKNSYFA